MSAPYKFVAIASVPLSQMVSNIGKSMKQDPGCGSLWRVIAPQGDCYLAFSPQF